MGYQDGCQEGGAGFLSYRTQSHGEEGIQARGGEGKSGLPQRTEAWRRRVDQKNKKKKKPFVFFCVAVKQISITHVFLLSTIFSLLSLSLFFWLVVQICSDDQYLTLYR